jgi:hypothetical protein
VSIKKGINMKKTMFITLVLTAELFAPSFVQAQGTLYVSNLGQTPAGSASIGSDSWIAQSFGILATDPNTYILNSIQLLMNPASGNPNGFSVSIYSSLNPINNLGNLSGPDPSAGGVFTYTASGITLSSGNYAVVVTAATPVAQGAYGWSAANGVTQDGTWYINDGYSTSADGLSWTGHVRQNVFQLAIYATEVPEPATYALTGVGLAALSFWRRKP